MLDSILVKKNMNIRQLSQKANVGYNYVYRLAHNQVKIDNCSLGTASKIATALDMSLNEFYYEMQPSFLNFRSDLHHRIKESEKETILYILTTKSIKEYMEHGNYVKGLYTLATLDYLCNKNEYSLISDYDDYRSMSLREPFYPNSLVKKMVENKKIKCIPEYVKYNIYEGDLYDAC